MPEYHFRVESLEAAVADAKRREADVRAGIHKAQLDSGLELLSVLVQDIDQEGLVDRSEMKQSGDVHDHGEGGVAVSFDAPHAGVVMEHGARPFRPPFGPIFEWVKRKAARLGIVQLKPGARFRGPASLNADQDAAAKRLAWAIVNAIAKRGFPARHMMRKRQGFAVAALERALDEHVRNVARRRRGGDMEPTEAAVRALCDVLRAPLPLSPLADPAGSLAEVVAGYREADEDEVDPVLVVDTTGPGNQVGRAPRVLDQVDTADPAIVRARVALGPLTVPLVIDGFFPHKAKRPPVMKAVVAALHGEPLGTGSGQIVVAADHYFGAEIAFRAVGGVHYLDFPEAVGRNQFRGRLLVEAELEVVVEQLVPRLLDLELRFTALRGSRVVVPEETWTIF